MSHEQLQEFKCPKCGGPMQPGYVAGQWTRLRWCEKANTKTIFAGKPLKKERDLWNAPTLQAVRCTDCKLGIFVYDN